MCPSYRVTRDEKDVTRGRANTLRLAVTGQIGQERDHLRRNGGDDEAVRLLQGLPARMPDRRRHGAHEDRGAGRARQGTSGCRCAIISSAICRATRLTRRGCPGCSTRAIMCPAPRRLMESVVGLSARRKLPGWRRDMFRIADAGPAGGPEVVLFADTFNRYFERGKSARRGHGAHGRRLSRACRQGARDRRARSVAAGHSSPSAPSRRRRRRCSARSMRSRLSSPAACRWWDWSRAASSVSATKFPA